MSIDGYARYAVYWAPPRGSGLARAGAAWLGWDPEARRVPEPPELALPAGLARADLTEAPRRYGLHATLKAPFRLAEGTTPAALDAALARLAAARAPAAAPPLRVDAELGFLALRPAGPCPEIDALAAACVEELDLFRAPLTEAERARRLAKPLPPDRLANLERWGYPHVFDAFRFHVTLASPVPAEAEPPLAVCLEAHLAPHLAEALPLRELCLFGDPGGGRPFHLLARHALTG